jgi:hypothetical protein
METEHSAWEHWAKLFAARRRADLPALEPDSDYSALPDSLAKSLAIFQLGESGGGTIVQQAWPSTLAGVDEYYAAAMALFVDDEHRHANILAICVRLLGGTLIRSNWTARLFVFTRRLIGLRLKVLVLLAAEVIGLCFYHLLAVNLPPSNLRSRLMEIVEDERCHLYFHCAFLRSQARKPWQKRVFVCVWRSVMLAASVAVIIDHRRAIQDMNIGIRKITARWKTYCELAEALVVTDIEHSTESTDGVSFAGNCSAGQAASYE